MYKKRKRDTKKTTHLKMKICVVREGETNLLNKQNNTSYKEKNIFIY